MLMARHVLTTNAEVELRVVGRRAARRLRVAASKARQSAVEVLLPHKADVPLGRPLRRAQIPGSPVLSAPELPQLVADTSFPFDTPSATVSLGVVRPLAATDRLGLAVAAGAKQGRLVALVVAKHRLRATKRLPRLLGPPAAPIHATQWRCDRAQPPGAATLVAVRRATRPAAGLLSTVHLTINAAGPLV